MNHPKPSNSSFRYLIAGLKPLANVKVWGSLGIMGLVGFVLWQYYHHPEWLGNDQLPTSSIEGEVEGEVGNSVDIGVTVQDLERNRLNSPGFPPALSPLGEADGSSGQPFNPAPGNQPSLDATQNAPLFPPSTDGNNEALNQQPNPPIKFEPLMPNVKNLGSLFPPLTPSKNASQPIKIPDSLQETETPPPNHVLENALEDVFSQESPSVNPSSPSSPENKQPSANPNQTNSSPQPNYPTPSTSGRNNPYRTQPYTQPNNPNQPYNNPYNNPYTYTPPQPYNQPYGNGTAPAPARAYPPSPQSPNNYRTANPNPNYPNPNATNQNQRTPNYGIQPPQVDQYGGQNNY